MVDNSSGEIGGVHVDSDRRLVRLRRYAGWLDEGIHTANTRIPIGLDPVIGLIPGVGDAIGALMASVIFVEAVRRGVSRYTLGRIAWNIAFDALLGAIPIFGDIFDMAWKANIKNIALIERHMAAPPRAKKADRLFAVSLAVGLALTCVALLVASIFLTAWVVRYLID